MRRRSLVTPSACSPGPFTIFAPIDPAFQQLGDNVADYLFNPEVSPAPKKRDVRVDACYLHVSADAQTHVLASCLSCLHVSPSSPRGRTLTSTLPFSRIPHCVRLLHSLPAPHSSPSPFDRRAFANNKALQTVLTYHAISGNIQANQIKDGQVIPTVDAGQSVTAHIRGGQVYIQGGFAQDEARVLRANVECSNGVIHVIDHLLIPDNFVYPKDDIPTTAEGVSALSTLVTALKTGDVVRALSYPEGPFTVFAPDNQAFANLPAGILAYLLAHPQELDQILAYHVVDQRGDRGRGRLYADEIANFQQVFTLQGQELVFVVAGGKVLVNGNATVIQVRASLPTANTARPRTVS